MKITIWIHKSEAISGEITDYSYTRPYQDRNEEYVEVQITQDEFAILEDKSKTSIFEKNPDTGEVFKREIGNYEDREIVSDEITSDDVFDAIAKRSYPTQDDIIDFNREENRIKDLEERIHKESQSTTGGEFSEWHSNLTSEEKAIYKKIYGH